jgi:DNA excision repair protein ERCC-4
VTGRLGEAALGGQLRQRAARAGPEGLALELGDAGAAAADVVLGLAPRRAGPAGQAGQAPLPEGERLARLLELVLHAGDEVGDAPQGTTRGVGPDPEPPEPVLVDHRERGSGIPAALEAAGVPVELTDLPVGDYVLGAGLAVERKGPADLAASIRDGRLFDQAVRLQSAYAQAVLVVEGEPTGIAEAAWRGAVCRLVEDGITVLHSLDAEDSAAWVVRLARRARRAAPSPRTEGPRRAPRHPSAQAEAMLSAVPGISTPMARSLLEAFGSVAAIATAAPDGLRGHPGIGPVRAARLAEALTAAWVRPDARDPEPPRPERAPRPPRRWVLLQGEDDGSAPRSFDRRAIALRALRGAPAGSRLVDSLTGEVVAAA